MAENKGPGVKPRIFQQNPNEQRKVLETDMLVQIYFVPHQKMIFIEFTKSLDL